MRKVEELINKTEPGWPLVKEWIEAAKNKVEILPADADKAKEALYKTQVTTRSPMGAIVFMTGGILIDNGWIRILGSGSARLTRSLPDWNKGKAYDEFGIPSPFLLIADDVMGGFFMLNGGGLGEDLGNVYYFAPDTLEFEPLEMSYTDFLSYCFEADLDEFYEGYRWKNWKKEVAEMSGDEVFNFYPPLWTEEGEDMEKSSRKAVPIEEQYALNLEFRKEIGLE